MNAVPTLVAIQGNPSKKRTRNRGIPVRQRYLTILFSALALTWDGTGAGQHGRELWSYTTPGGAALVADLNTNAHVDGGTRGSGTGPLTAFGLNAYFRAASTTAGPHDYELWSYDGSSAPVFQRSLRQNIGRLRIASLYQRRYVCPFTENIACQCLRFPTFFPESACFTAALIIDTV